MDSRTWPRSAGILLHVSSLPGPFPIGDFGASAYRFVKMLKQAKMNWWQVLPLNTLSIGSSPYSTISSFALEPLYLDIDLLREAGLITKFTRSSLPSQVNEDNVDFSLARKIKTPIFQEAFQNWCKKRAYKEKDFSQFCEEEKDWLDDFALYSSLSERYASFQWILWPQDIRSRDPEALQRARNELAEKILYYGFLQYYTYKSWFLLKANCKEEEIRIFGDLPIYQDLASCDVWVKQEQFQLDVQTAQPTHVAGVPPDAFNKLGQKWGHPLYNWQRMEDDGFQWWKARIKHQLKLYDASRLDHFIGYYRHWSIPAADNDARSGKWLPSKGHELLSSLREEIPQLPIVAEDLGDIIPAVINMRDELELPGMKVIQFGFGESADRDHLPHRFQENYFAYSGTHDNDTTRGWFGSQKNHDAELADRICQYFRSSERDIVWSIIASLYGSVARIVIIPMQDILGLGSEARLNVPGDDNSKWDWRMRELDFSPIADKLARLADLYERDLSAIEENPRNFYS